MTSEIAVGKRGPFLAIVVLLCIGMVFAADFTQNDQSVASLYNLTNNGAVYQPSANAFAFSGTVNLTSLNYTTLNRSGLTVSVWTRRSNSATSNVLQFFDKSMIMYVTSGNALHCVMSNATAQVDASSGAVVATGGHHFGCAYNGTHISTLYDGAKIGTPGALTGNLNFSNATLQIGRGNQATNLVGNATEVRVYNFSLSAAQYTLAYQNLSTACASQTGWYPFQNVSVSCDSFCSYQGAGNWPIRGYENCQLTTATNALGNNISYASAGNISLTGSITNYSVTTASGNVTLTVSAGGRLG